MPRREALRDHALIDALDAIAPVTYNDTVWRVTREGRDPCQCSQPGGRWDDGSFGVLYTAEASDGAIAEMYFHLRRGQPVFPSQVKYKLHKLNATLSQALKLVDLVALAKLDLDTARYGQLSYQERTVEYPRSQDIAEAAYFLEFDGLIVPNARWECMNIVLFCDRLPADATQAIEDLGLIDWTAWQRENSA